MKTLEKKFKYLNHTVGITMSEAGAVYAILSNQMVIIDTATRHYPTMELAEKAAISFIENHLQLDMFGFENENT